MIRLAVFGESGTMDRGREAVRRKHGHHWGSRPPVMLSYALAAVAEILKANVSSLDAAVAAIVFALTSIATIAAPVGIVVVAPDRSAQVLATWKQSLLANSRSIALIAHGYWAHSSLS